LSRSLTMKRSSTRMHQRQPTRTLVRSATSLGEGSSLPASRLTPSTVLNCEPSHLTGGNCPLMISDLARALRFPHTSIPSRQQRICTGMPFILDTHPEIISHALAQVHPLALCTAGELHNRASGRRPNQLERDLVRRAEQVGPCRGWKLFQGREHWRLVRLAPDIGLSGELRLELNNFTT
jgi:hypothetical protein